MTEKNLLHGNTSIRYTVSGRGEPALFIHGFGEDGRVWDEMRSNLENQYQVIVPDLPGSGASTALSSETTMESLAGAVRLVLDNEGIGRCSMIGHSMGGYVVLAFAEKYPGIPNKIGLFHSTAFPDSEEKKAARKKNIEFIQQNGSLEFLKQSIPTLFSPETRRNKPALVRETIQRYSNFSAESLVHYTAAMMNRPDRTDILKNFPGPVLFIMGEYDTAVPLEQGLQECHLPGISYIYICTHSGHSGMLEEPEFCITAARYFLSGK